MGRACVILEEASRFARRLDLQTALMKHRNQLRSGIGAQPLWQRVLAIACLLLVGFASSAQAVHVHGQWLPDSHVHASAAADASQLPGSEADCPLCVAMHSAMPATIAVPTTALVADETARVSLVAERVPETQWHYAGFSRPPPVARLS